uniref:UDP-N-acetylglucosamine transferase subunit ALG13 n=1 Tax=Coturnix japonica TaxID=93934 RepID=A0A8C2U0F1_COTJA
MKSVFVTVGTTSFDELIAAVSSPAAEQVLRSRGCRQLVLQIGRGAMQPSPQHGPTFVREVFRFKESLAEELRSADLVISHAGGAWWVAQVCFWGRVGHGGLPRCAFGGRWGMVG